jgi:hypothetical protein
LTQEGELPAQPHLDALTRGLLTVATLTFEEHNEIAVSAGGSDGGMSEEPMTSTRGQSLPILHEYSEDWESDRDGCYAATK